MTSISDDFDAQILSSQYSLNKRAWLLGFLVKSFINRTLCRGKLVSFAFLFNHRRLSGISDPSTAAAKDLLYLRLPATTVILQKSPATKSVDPSVILKVKPAPVKVILFPAPAGIVMSWATSSTSTSRSTCLSGICSKHPSSLSS